MYFLLKHQDRCFISLGRKSLLPKDVEVTRVTEEAEAPFEPGKNVREWTFNAIQFYGLKSIVGYFKKLLWLLLGCASIFTSFLAKILFKVMDPH